MDSSLFDSAADLVSSLINFISLIASNHICTVLIINFYFLFSITGVLIVLSSNYGYRFSISGLLRTFLFGTPWIIVIDGPFLLTWPKFELMYNHIVYDVILVITSWDMDVYGQILLINCTGCIIDIRYIWLLSYWIPTSCQYNSWPLLLMLDVCFWITAIRWNFITFMTFIMSKDVLPGIWKMTF